MPEEKLFDIWVEGYCATGNESEAQYLGSVTAVSFREAVKKWAQQNPGAVITDTSVATDEFRYWGCRLFESEEKARLAFG